MANHRRRDAHALRSAAAGTAGLSPPMSARRHPLVARPPGPLLRLGLLTRRWGPRPSRSRLPRCVHGVFRSSAPLMLAMHGSRYLPDDVADRAFATQWL